MMCLVEHCAWAVGFAAKSALPNEDKDACRLLYSGTFPFTAFFDANMAQYLLNWSKMPTWRPF